MSEYVLQKRTLFHWSYVTWYSDLQEAHNNFKNCSKEGSGYSWRLVELTVLEQKLNDGEFKDEAQLLEKNDTPKASQQTVQPVKSDWGSPVASGWNKLTPDLATPSHGSVGKVWLGNPTTKEKKRVDPAEVDGMMAEGWIKAGPRTVL